jgi:hypothetical protein
MMGGGGTYYKNVKTKQQYSNDKEYMEKNFIKDSPSLA